MRKEDKTDEVKRLISMGKEKGFLTYRDLNSTLPADMVSSERLSSLMTMFGEMDIEIAKRIEDGKQDISTVVFGMPMTIKAVFALIDLVKANKVPIREVVSAGVEEEFEEGVAVEQDDGELRQRTLEGVRKAKVLAKALLALYARNRKPARSPAK